MDFRFHYLLPKRLYALILQNFREWTQRRQADLQLGLGAETGRGIVLPGMTESVPELYRIH